MRLACTAAVLSAAALVTACSRHSAAMAANDVLPPLGEDFVSADAHPKAQVPALDRPIVALCADPLTREVLDQDLPGLRQRPEFVAFSRMSLRQLQMASGGRLSERQIARVGRDLHAAEIVPPLRSRTYASALRPPGAAG